VPTPPSPDGPPPLPAAAVAVARQKFNCPACGGEAQWNPAKHALICPYCGTESPAELQERDGTTVIVEHDLDFIRDICDVLTVLDQGKVLDTGTVDEIQRSERVQQVYTTRV